MIDVKHALATHVVAATLIVGCAVGDDRDPLRLLESLVATDPKPFVLVEASGTGFVGKGQGVVISSHGHVLSAGHVSWDDANQRFVDSFRVSFRSKNGNLPPGALHSHRAVYVDRENVAFHENWYGASLLKQNDSRFVAKGDLSLLRINTDSEFPEAQFFSEERPEVRTGEVLHLCHYPWPHKDADPFFLVNPVEVVGVVQTTSGLQYLARGYYRWGSSGGAILKEGRLIGIQSSAYTVNAKDIGEMPIGLLSFQLVWRSMFSGLLGPRPADTGDRPGVGSGAESPARTGGDDAAAH